MPLAQLQLQQPGVAGVRLRQPPVALAPGQLGVRTPQVSGNTGGGVGRESETDTFRRIPQEPKFWLELQRHIPGIPEAARPEASHQQGTELALCECCTLLLFPSRTFAVPALSLLSFPPAPSIAFYLHLVPASSSRGQQPGGAKTQTTVARVAFFRS